MLVDMNAVIPCIVVSSPISSARLPINAHEPDRRELVGYDAEVVCGG
jgi:hypothetical protein